LNPTYCFKYHLLSFGNLLRKNTVPKFYEPGESFILWSFTQKIDFWYFEKLLTLCTINFKTYILSAHHTYSNLSLEDMSDVTILHEGHLWEIYQWRETNSLDWTAIWGDEVICNNTTTSYTCCFWHNLSVFFTHLLYILYTCIMCECFFMKLDEIPGKIRILKPASIFGTPSNGLALASSRAGPHSSNCVSQFTRSTG